MQSLRDTVIETPFLETQSLNNSTPDKEFFYQISKIINRRLRQYLWLLTRVLSLTLDAS